MSDFPFEYSILAFKSSKGIDKLKILKSEPI